MEVFYGSKESSLLRGEGPEKNRGTVSRRFLSVVFPCLSRGPAQGALLRESMLAMLPEKPVRFGPRNRLPGFSRRAGRFWGVTGGTACSGRFGYWNIIAQMGGGWKGKRGDFARQQKNTQANAWVFFWQFPKKDGKRCRSGCSGPLFR